MTIIFDILPSGKMRMYIHTFSAADQANLNQKLHTHSEYDTTWSNKISKWIDESYFVNVNREDMIGFDTCITVLTFYSITPNYYDFIRDINSYLGFSSLNSGAHIVEFKLFSKTS
jgi:hypothetical protein